MKIFLDDVRSPPSKDWVVARTTEEAKRLLSNNPDVDTMSLDHDMGMNYCTPCAFQDAEEPCFKDGEQLCDCTCHVPLPTGKDLLVWMRDSNLWPKNKPNVHSANPVGAKSMVDFIEDFGPYGKE